MTQSSARMQWPYPTQEDDPWYTFFEDLVRAQDASGFAHREDRSIIWSGGGTVEWNLGTETLSWDESIRIYSPIGSRLISVEAGTVANWADGEVVYVVLTRQPLENLTATFVKASQLVSSDNAMSLAVRIGDYIYFRTGMSLGPGDTSAGIAPVPGGAGAGVFEVDAVNNEIQPVLAEKGRSFVVGSQSTEDTGVIADDTRMFFSKSDSSFRAGRVTGTEWDAASRGASSAAFGERTVASGDQSFACGLQTDATGDRGSHAEGFITNATGRGAHAEGRSTWATGDYSHAEGLGSYASSRAAHAEGTGYALSGYAHAEGYGTQATQDCAHAEGYYTLASGRNSHSEGYQSEARSTNSHAEGYGCIAEIWAYGCHAEGYWTHSRGGDGSHAEGGFTYASGFSSHAEGASTSATGFAAHSEGSDTTASGYASHSAGRESVARLRFCHATAGRSFSSFGDGQNLTVNAGSQTFNATPRELSTGYDLTTSDLDMQPGSVWGFIIRVVGKTSEGVGGDSFFAIIEGLIKYDGVSVALVPGPSPLLPRAVFSSGGAAAWQAYVQNDPSNDFALVVIGDAVNVTRWVAEVQVTEIIYA